MVLIAFAVVLLTSQPDRSSMDESVTVTDFVVPQDASMSAASTVAVTTAAACTTSTTATATTAATTTAAATPSTSAAFSGHPRRLKRRHPGSVTELKQTTADIILQATKSQKDYYDAKLQMAKEKHDAKMRIVALKDQLLTKQLEE